VDAPGGAPRNAGLSLEPPLSRVVALGASNLTRGFPALVSIARDEWGSRAEVLVALGLGRSYGSSSRVLARTLPGILQSGLWNLLEDLPPASTRALITDVGNDILYGFGPERTLAWVEECIVRLQRFTGDIVLTDLPLASLRRLSRAKFLFFRSMLFPRCRLTLEQTLEEAQRVVEGLESLAAARGLRFFRMRPEWYGFDPIHIRPAMWSAAWRQILCGDLAGATSRGPSWLEALQLLSLWPEQQQLLGLNQLTPQIGRTLRRGARVWLY
jgi:hypothetical protein